MKELQILALHNPIIAAWLQAYQHGNQNFRDTLFGIIAALDNQNKHYQKLILKHAQESTKPWILSDEQPS